MVSPLRAVSNFGPQLVLRAIYGSDVLDSYLPSRFLSGSLHVGSLWGSEVGWYQERRRREDENPGPLMAGLFLSHRWRWKRLSVTLDQMSPSPISAPPHIPARILYLWWTQSKSELSGGESWTVVLAWVELINLQSLKAGLDELGHSLGQCSRFQTTSRWKEKLRVWLALYFFWLTFYCHSWIAVYI